MAIERTTLTQQTIARLLDEHYEIEVRGVQRLPLGTANCYRVHTDLDDVFLKEYQSGFDAQTVRREAAIVARLSWEGIPTALFLPTRRNEAFIEHDGHIICLQEFIEGETYGYNDFPRAMLPELGKMLGRLHTAMQGLDLPVSMAGEWLDGYDPAAQAARFAGLSALARQRGDALADRIARDMDYRSELAQRCDGYRAHYAGVTYTPTHGDYQGCQVICADGRIRAVTDFSAACTQVAVWEVMRSFVQSDSECRRTARIDAEALCDYVRRYMNYAYITRTDLAAMPYVYLFQLARSSYGYREYLTTDSEDRAGLIDFAFWRTAMCREVESRAQELSDALTKLR